MSEQEEIVKLWKAVQEMVREIHDMKILYANLNARLIKLEHPNERMS